MYDSRISDTQTRPQEHNNHREEQRRRHVSSLCFCSFLWSHADPASPSSLFFFSSSSSLMYSYFSLRLSILLSQYIQIHLKRLAEVHDLLTTTKGEVLLLKNKKNTIWSRLSDNVESDNRLTSKSILRSKLTNNKEIRVLQSFMTCLPSSNYPVYPSSCCSSCDSLPTSLTDDSRV